MKVSFGLGVGLAVLACLPDPASAQCFAAPRRAAYYPQPVQYVTPGQVVTYPAQPMPQVQPGTYIQGQPQPLVQGQPQPAVQPGQVIQQSSFYRPTVESGDVRRTMRHLWDDHILLTRFVLISALADLPDKEAAKERLVKNQTEIGNAVKSALGEANGEKLAGLLKTHVQLAAELIAAVKANDTTKKGDVTTKLQANSDEISTFLAAANPRAWPDQVVKGMMREHVDLLGQEIEARAKQDWAGDLAAFEKSREKIRHLADMLANGLGATPVSTDTIPAQQAPVRRFRR